MNFPTPKERPLPPAGICVARLYSVIDLGEQEQTDMKTGDTYWSPKVRFTWELPDHLLDDGRPMVIGKEYTWSSDDRSNLTKDLTAWLGKNPMGTPVADLLGKTCNLFLIHRESKKGKTYAAVNTIAPIGTAACGDPYNEQELIDLDSVNEGSLRAIPSWIVKIIAKSKQADENKDLAGICKDILEPTEIAHPF